MSDEEEEDEDSRHIVIESGTDNCKVGFAGNDYGRFCDLRSIFPNIVGRSRYPSRMVGMSTKEYYIGEEAHSKRGILNITHPVENGFIKNFDDMEKIWHYCFYNELRIEPEELNDVVLIEPSLNDNSNREKMAEIMFETFNIQNSLCIANEAVMSLYSYGLFTGVSVDLGASAKVVPVVESKVVTQGVSREFDISGGDLNWYLGSLLMEIGYYLSRTEALNVPKDIKEKSCFVALDFDERMKTPTDITYEFTDGQILSLGNLPFRCPEIFFQPSIQNSKNVTKGIHQIIYESVMKCDDAIQRNLFANIVLSGGHSLFPGLDNRLQKELEKLVPPDIGFFPLICSLPGKVSVSFERKHAAWTGGSMLASSECLKSYYQQMSITKEEYDETGPTIVLQKVL